MNKETIEQRLEGFLLLRNSGLNNFYINDNLKFYKNKLEEVYQITKREVQTK